MNLILSKISYIVSTEKTLHFRSDSKKTDRKKLILEVDGDLSKIALKSFLKEMNFSFSKVNSLITTKGKKRMIIFFNSQEFLDSFLNLLKE